MVQAAMRQSRRFSWKVGGAAILAVGMIGLAGFGLRSALPALARETPRCAYLYLDADLDEIVTPGIDTDVSADHEHFELVVTDQSDSLVYRGAVDGCHLPREATNSRLALTLVYGTDHAMVRPVTFVQIPASVHDVEPTIFLIRENFRR
jgi:hypothetical protein